MKSKAALLTCAIITVTGSIGLGFGGIAWSETAQPSNWPCIQRKITSLSPGMMWAGPPLEEAAGKKDDPEIKRLAKRLSARRTSSDETTKLITEFASKVAPGARPNKLTALFAGVFAFIDRERKLTIDGIERYTVKQRALADRIGEIRRQSKLLRELKNPTPEDRKKLKKLEDELLWQSRIHRDREQSLTYVCEVPVLLEKRAFAIAREITAHLE